MLASHPTEGRPVPSDRPCLQTVNGVKMIECDRGSIILLKKQESVYLYLTRPQANLHSQDTEMKSQMMHGPPCPKLLNRVRFVGARVRGRFRHCGHDCGQRIGFGSFDSLCTRDGNTMPDPSGIISNTTLETEPAVRGDDVLGESGR